jgi:hypothetical protein
MTSCLERRRDNMTTPQHCPGFENFKNLTSFFCKCPRCGRELEIFSDEVDREHFCKACNQKIDFTMCELYATGEDRTSR